MYITYLYKTRQIHMHTYVIYLVPFMLYMTYHKCHLFIIFKCKLSIIIYVTNVYVYIHLYLCIYVSITHVHVCVCVYTYIY